MVAHRSRGAQRQRVVIIGGGVAGVAVGAALRSDGFPGRLLLVSDECALPYRRSLLATAYLRGQASRGDLLIHPAEWYRQTRIDLLLGARATRIDRLARTVEIRGHGPVRYDRLVLATGRAEHVPAGLRSAHGIASVAAVDALRADARTAGTAIVVGTGTVADDAAAALRSLGPRVTQIHPDALRDGADAADLADLVVRALGTRPDTRLASNAGLGSLTRVSTDPAGRTIDPAIVATGGLLGIEDEAAAATHAMAAARAVLGMDDIPAIDGRPPSPAGAAR